MLVSLNNNNKKQKLDSLERENKDLNDYISLVNSQQEEQKAKWDEQLKEQMSTQQELVRSLLFL